tara:strand:- start:170 stop:1606 length:1437 start_codon:yes stop_codon:yes gene_type:complete
MDFITQEREKILFTDNTAQQRMVDLLEDMNKKISTLEFSNSLHGDLDFSVLFDMGFRGIDTIIIPEGNITDITNLPKGLNTFICKRNLIVSIKSLPSSLTNITINNNYLSEIDVSHIKNLTILDVQNNNIHSLENLPSTITELRCDYNKLERLNLTELTNLKKLHISNNNITVIENLPEDLVEFQMENTPSIEFRNIEADNLNELISAETEEDNDYYDTLDKYFSLKNKYENKMKKAMKQVYDKNNKRKSQSKIASMKYQCIRCKRMVNTIFSTKDNRYIAICGDSQNPCDLKIEIYNGQFTHIENMLIDANDSLNDIKNIIIEQKLDNLFGYVNESDSVKLFKDQITAYNEEMNNYNYIKNMHDELLNKKETQDRIAALKNEVFVLKDDITQLLDEYKKTENKEILKNAVDTQITKIIPKMRNIHMLKNEINEELLMFAKDSNKKNKIGHIFNYPILLNKLEYNLAEKPNVISFTSN